MSRTNLRAMNPFTSGLLSSGRRSVALLAFGLAALLIALFALMQMIAAERADALASLETREHLVLDHAGTEFGEQLGENLARAERAIERAVRDPLRACRGCYHAEYGAQILPRLGPDSAAAVHGETPVRDGYVTLRDAGRDDRVGGTSAPEGGDGSGSVAGAGDRDDHRDVTWMDRVALHRACGGEAGAMNGLLEHRGAYVLPLEQEIASTLALIAHCDPPAGLLPALLRDGMAPPGGRRIAGLQPMVLRDLHRLGPADGAFVVQRVIEVSTELGVETREFEERLTELQSEPLALPPGPESESVSPGGTSGLVRPVGELSLARASDAYWLLKSTSSGERGLAVDLGAILHDIARTMKERGLLQPDDRIELRLRERSRAPLSQLTLHVVSPQLRRARTAVADRYMLKVGLLGLCGAMGVIIAVLALALQRRRRRLLELKSHFIASVSHELRTPLASMRVLVETLARRTKGMPEVRDYPARVLGDIDGMSFLVENILSFNRLAKGQWQQRTVPIKLAEVVASACEEAEEWHSRPILVHEDLGDVVITAEPELLRLLFRNLALNAVTYNRREPVELSIHLGSGPRQELDVLFRDNGVGIAAGETERVFDEFVRGSASSMARGSGLGLALCRRIMAMHDGTIKIVDSSDEGTTFRLRFP